MTEARTKIEWRPRSTAGAISDRTVGDDPGRLVLLVAAVGLLIPAFTPWAEGLDAGGHPAVYTPQQGLAEGFIMLVLAIILALMARGHFLIQSTSRTLQLSPLAVAVVATAMWIGADRNSAWFVDYWTDGGGSGVQTAWRYVAAAAIAAIVAGTIWLEMTRPPEIRAATRGLVDEWRPSRVGVAEALLAAGFGFVFAIAAGAITIAWLGPNGAIFAVFLVLLGMGTGISVGLGIARWYRGGADRATPRDSGMDSTKGRVTVTRVERRRS